MEPTSQFREPKSPPVTGWTRKVVIALDHGIFALAQHWLWAFNLVVALYVGVPFLAPVFMHLGWDAPARIIYLIYSPLCNQWAHHSWFLFGERTYYPSAIFQAYTGIDPNTYAGILAARAFVGNALMG
jgi:hypothetical protein